MYTTRLNLLKQGSIVYPKIQVVAHYYQRFSSSQYLLQMQVQAQQKYLNPLTKRMIPFPHTKLTQDQKGLYKACNGVECKGMSQRDSKSSYIVYETSFGLIIAIHSCSFNYEHYSKSSILIETETQICQGTATFKYIQEVAKISEGSKSFAIKTEGATSSNVH
ncbi:hypothetical protein H5410_002993 [Solanum commersonii]|uniref:Uncharacterized protein n=1 Tax=Solanum commersonii TaxID=4109 RepID=A0A9J6B3Q9_SOLCO|nr:hypothetical protein H5410_002993 [Solanum commersonii]